MQHQKEATKSSASIASNGHTKAYLVGGGIASLASAAYLIRDGQVAGNNTHILGETDQTRGSMDAHGTAETLNMIATIEEALE